MRIDWQLRPISETLSAILTRPEYIPDGPFSIAPSPADVAELRGGHGLFRSLSAFDSDLLPFILGQRKSLTDQERGWLQHGLIALQNTSRVGLRTLITTARRDPAYVTSDDVVLSLSPRLNALRRFGGPQDFAQLLTTRSEEEAFRLATQAEAFYRKSRLIDRQTLETAHTLLQADSSLLNWEAMVLESSGWELDRLAFAARHLADALHKPVALLRKVDNISEGWAFSGGGYELGLAFQSPSVKEVVAEVQGDNPYQFRLAVDNLPMFRRRLSNALAQQTPEPDSLSIAAELTFTQVTLEIAQKVETLGPFLPDGRPVFVARNLKQIRSAKAGRDNQHHRLTLRDESGLERSVMFWNSADQPLPEGVFDLAFRMRPIYRDGGHELEITLVAWQQVIAPEEKAERPTLIDLRQGANLTMLQVNEPMMAIWAEGFSAKESPGLPLSELAPADALLVYTTPASSDDLARAIRRVQPKRVYWLGESPPFETPDKLLAGVAALLKTTQSQFSGQLKITQLAERLAHPSTTIRLALDCFVQTSALEWINNTTLRVISVGDTPKASAELVKAIEETAAYRRYTVRTIPENLLP